MKKQRLILVTGYYSILNTVSVLKQINSNDFENILIIIVNQMDKDKIYNFASQFKEFHKIIITFKKGKNIKSLLSNHYFDEIVIPFYKTYTILLKQKIDAKKLIICDEGIETYRDLNNIKINNNKQIDVYLLDKNYLDNNLLLNNTNIYSININKFFSTLKEIKNQIILKDNSVIFLSSVSPWKTDRDEEKAYNQQDINMINILISKGYNVYYKLHPRNYSMDTSELVNIINSNKFHIFDTNKHFLIEVDLLNNKDKIQFIVSGYTTTLFFSYNLFGIPAFSMLNNNQTKDKYLKIKTLKYLPSLNNFLKSKLDPKEFYNQKINFLNNNKERFEIIESIVFTLLKKEKKLTQYNKNLKIKYISSIFLLLILLIIFITYFIWYNI